MNAVSDVNYLGCLQNAAALEAECDTSLAEAHKALQSCEGSDHSVLQ